jgi:predicted DNA-binding ribbon-helix-helix protein
MKKSTPVTLEDNLLEKLKEVARMDGRTVSNLVERWIREELSKSSPSKTAK